MAAPTTRIRFGSATHAGHMRAHNEDAHAFEPDLGLAVVADGLGGHAAGEVASAVAVTHVLAAVGGGAGLVEAVTGAHAAVRAAAADGRGAPGMGTTLVALQAGADGYHLVWVGDSRAYVHDGALRRLSRDHSLVQEWVDAGLLTPAEAAEHPQRAVVTRVLGGGLDGAPEPEAVRGRLATGARLLLCSDGLTNELDDNTLERLLARAADPQTAADALVQAALDAGGRDNITVVVVDWNPQ